MQVRGARRCKALQSAAKRRTEGFSPRSRRVLAASPTRIEDAARTRRLRHGLTRYLGLPIWQLGSFCIFSFSKGKALHCAAKRYIAPQIAAPSLSP
jgi:hypothetical protein